MQLVRDLTDPEVLLCGKSKEVALEAKGKGNECFSKGDYSNALHFYSQVKWTPPYFLTMSFLSLPFHRFSCLCIVAWIIISNKLLREARISICLNCHCTLLQRFVSLLYPLWNQLPVLQLDSSLRAHSTPFLCLKRLRLIIVFFICMWIKQALRSAPMNVEDNEKNLVATLYLNRASSLHVSFRFVIIFKPSVLLSSTLEYHLVRWDDFSSYWIWSNKRGIRY